MSQDDTSYNPSQRPPAGPSGAEGLEAVDINERGFDKNGAPHTMNRRLFMQLLAFRCDADLAPSDAISTIGEGVKAAGVGVTVYEDANDPRGIAVLSFSEAPEDFVEKVRPVLASVRGLSLVPEMTMMGRTYSHGHEQDVEYWLLNRPRETAVNPAWKWAVWYPLRRSGEFARLEGREQAKILKEHAIIGRAYGAKDLAHDIRLACHGLDAKDNEFVIGLIGADLHPLSHVVQRMRKTRQTSEYIKQMGPFFVGRAAFQFNPPA